MAPARHWVRGQEIVFDAGLVCALSTPTFVYDASVKYQVPALKPLIVTVVVPGFPMSTIWFNAPALVP